MRTIEFKRSFDRSYKHLPSLQKDRVDETIKEFLNLIEKRQIPQGMGLKRLQADQWEIRIDLDLRICFQMSKNRIEFVLVGTHDDIKKYLKNL